MKVIIKKAYYIIVIGVWMTNLKDLGLSTEDYEKIMLLIRIFKAQKVTVWDIKKDVDNL